MDRENLEESKISHKLQESGQLEILPRTDESPSFQQPPKPPSSDLGAPPSERFSVGAQDLDPFRMNKGEDDDGGGMYMGPSHPIFHDVTPRMPSSSSAAPFATLPP